MTFDILKGAIPIALLGVSCSGWAGDASFDAELLAIQQEWASAKYQTEAKQARKDAFDELLRHASALGEHYPHDVEAVAWEGIVLSTYAGEVGAMSALKYAKAARKALLKAESMDANALDGGVYASLGALYSKVPGGMLGFGDDELAEQYFNKALAVDADSIDSNYFYGEFLLEHDRLPEAADALNRALSAPEVTSRPVFDAGRRAEIRSLLDTVAERAGS